MNSKSFERCFVCDKPMRSTHRVVTEDGAQHPFVGPECYRHIRKCGDSGYQPSRGGPRLFAIRALLNKEGR
jgi:hypothetical protein